MYRMLFRVRFGNYKIDEKYRALCDIEVYEITWIEMFDGRIFNRLVLCSSNNKYLSYIKRLHHVKWRY